MPTVSAFSSQAQRLRELIRDVRFAMLTTRAVDGTLSSRPMTTLQTDFDGTLWFLAAADSLNAMDIEQRPKVNLGYASPDSGRYVSVSGTARVMHDRAKARELWQPQFQAWFPGGADDDNLAVVQVEIASADYWEIAASKGEQVYAAEGGREAIGTQTHVQFSTAAQEHPRPQGRC
ncbi:MAG: pyridoxamine 5'-phosphate oxidase family protein [Burkholderiales bacterium]|nr:pyridoxamine 5'-phosphate oxidase family protein [Burkholderiales bacterium]